MTDLSSLIALPQERWMGGETYYRYTCSKCGEEARNTYVKPTCHRMLENQHCFTCDHWSQFDERMKANHTRATIIDGAIYTPGSRTSGEMRGMAGRRFDIEYIEPSVYAGQRITTFDLWTGGALPEWLRDKYADTAVFLNGAERCQVGDTGCWNPSSNKTEPYQLPHSLRALQQKGGDA